MARPLKQGLEYFPLDVDFFEDIKVRKIKKAFGASAISVLVSLLCSIYRDTGYYIGWNEDNAFLISETVGVTEGAVNEILNKALQVEFFDKRLFDTYKIITSKGIQKRFSHVVKSNKIIRDEIISKYNLLVNSEEIEKHTEEIPISTEETKNSTEESTQRKEKKSKVKESKVKNNNKPLDSDIILNNFSFSDKIKNIIEKWLQYKKEKGQTYKKTGLETLLDSIQSKVQEIGEDLVVENINDSIAKNYAGIFYNKTASKTQSTLQKSDTYNANMEFLASTDFNEVLNGSK